MSQQHESTPVEGPSRPSGEPRGQRLLRHGRRAGLYTWAVLALAGLVALIVLIAANVRSVKLDWVVGSTHASLVWIILAAAVLGWLIQITTTFFFSFPPPPPPPRAWGAKTRSARVRVASRLADGPSG